MGAAGSSAEDLPPSELTVKNRTGKEVRVICWCASDGEIPSMTAVVFRDTIPHGAEQKIQAARHDSEGLRIVVQLDGRLPFAALIPNSATLLLRDCGQGIARLCQQGSETWELPAFSDAVPVLDALGLESAAAAEALRLADHRGPVAQVTMREEDEAPSGGVTRAATAAVKPDPVETAAGIAPNPDAATQRSVHSSSCGIVDATKTASGAGSTSEPVRRKQPETAGVEPPTCPISHAVFVDPVLAADGFTYERECIEEWWLRRGPLSPMTGRPVVSTDLVPNLAIRALCAEYMQRPLIQGEAAASEGTFYEPHLPSLYEMFAHLNRDEIRAVCAGLWEEGVVDIDVCVRRLLERYSISGEAVAVSLAPVCCAGRTTRPEEAAAVLDPRCSIPQDWSVEREQLFAELLDFQFPPVRARKAIELGCADTFEEAVVWLERHQDDPNIDVPIEVMKEREDHRLAMTVMRIGKVPAAHRLDCLMNLHKILGRIMADPESQRLRQLRLRNEKFHKQIGRFPPAVQLLRAVGFQQGDFWVSESLREPCLEFKLPVDSDNPKSLRFVRAFSMLEHLLQEPDIFLCSVGEVQPEVTAAWVEAPVPSDQAAPSEPAGSTVPSDGAEIAASTRAFLADMHERRIRDPRGFQEAMRAAGRKPNRVIVNMQQPSASAPSASAASTQEEEAKAKGAGGYRRLDERFGGRRNFDLRDLEAMRVGDAIAGRTYYAREYDEQRGTSNSYADLLTRSYDPQYLGRKALDDTNTFRAQEQMPPMRWSQALSDIAAEHARQMARGEMPFSHQGFDDRTRRYPFAYFSAAENLAYNGGVADAAGCAVDGWIKSPGHRKNLVGAFDLCGIGVAQSSSGQFYFTQLFARTAGPLC